MSEPIKAGDLVVVLRHCTTSRHNGTIHTVARTFTAINSDCVCGVDHSGVLGAQLNGVWETFAQSWLKRLPPLTEPESIERETDAPRERVFIDRKRGILA